MSPISFAEVGKTLGLKQGWQITNGDILQGVRETIIEALRIKGNGDNNGRLQS